MNYQQQIETWFADKEPVLIDAVSRLVSIRSIKGDPAPGAPFGPGPAAALDEALKVAEEFGLATMNHDGYVGTADLNDQDTALHILAHLDVVHEGTGWTAGRGGRLPPPSSPRWWTACSTAGAPTTTKAPPSPLCWPSNASRTWGCP